MLTFKGKTIADCLDSARKFGITTAPAVSKRINGVCKAVFPLPKARRKSA